MRTMPKGDRCLPIPASTSTGSKAEKIEAESPKIPDDGKKPNTSESGKLAGVAKKVVLKPGTYEYQGGFLVARELPESDRHVIVNGHRRLVDQRKIIFAAADLK